MKTLFDAVQKHRPAIFVIRWFSRSLLSRLRLMYLVGFAILFLVSGVVVMMAPDWQQLFVGLTLIALAFYLEQVLLWSYHNTFYYFGLNSIIGLDAKKTTGCTYEVAEALLPDKHDVSGSFVRSKLGQEILLRTGVSKEALMGFLNGERRRISSQEIKLAPKEIYTLIHLGQWLLQQDQVFAQLLKENGVLPETFLGALSWIVGGLHQQKRSERWWSKDNLSKTKGLAREWTYGKTLELLRYTKDLRLSAVYANLTNESADSGEKIQEMEHILARSKAANVLLLGEDGVGKTDLVIAMMRRMDTGEALSAVVEKHVLELDTDQLFASHDNKPDFEDALLSLLNESARAGNIIIMIQHVSRFIAEAKALEVNLPELLDPYLASPDLHIIATDTPRDYHTHLETLGGFVRRFHEILIETKNQGNSINIIKGLALAEEGKGGGKFTFSSLEALASAADRYLVSGVMPDKAIDLLIEVAAKSRTDNVELIDSDFVYKLVSENTGVPAGPIEEEERDLLLNLEEVLHQQVVGQDQAIDALARTMRRARANVQESRRPLGSFLFLGPTGVGKTETAKALAKVFFKSEEALSRLDMSEFSAEDALGRLIGSHEQSGALPNLLREHPYTVLLLDEFEKAHQSIHDLFLQILDEGVFTDGRGEQINARNSIVIATSNAGSDLIARTIEQRQALDTLNDDIIQHIIKESIFRPELINRFDNAIIFDPLSVSEQGQVASLMLNDLYERIRQQGYELVVTKELIDALVEKGYSPEFGGRSMRRVLQDVVEEKVARKIIEGNVQKGDTITLTVDDLDGEET